MPTIAKLVMCLLLVMLSPGLEAVAQGEPSAIAARAEQGKAEGLRRELCPDPKVTVEETAACTMADAETKFSEKADKACKGKCPKGCKYFGHTNPKCETVSAVDCDDRLGFWCPTQEVTCICIPDVV